jgi:hypothetical protein
VNKSALTGCLGLVLLIFLVSGCGPLRLPGSEKSASTPFLAPTPVSYQPPTQTPESTGASDVQTQPTQAAVCSDNLTFLSDVTIADGTEVEADATLDKRWEVENSGNCNWQENYRIRLIAGPEMGAQPEQALYPARSGTRAVVRIVFKAPTEAGTYRSAWQAVSPDGNPFGDPIFIVIVVN